MNVMSTVTLILEWVLQFVNGGILNVIFTPQCDKNLPQCNYTFGINQQKILNYFKAVILISGKDLPLDVLESFPNDLGGGETGVKEARQHPNRESVFMVGPLVATILMLTAIIGLIIICLCTCCCGGRSGGKSKGKRKRRKEAKKIKAQEMQSGNIYEGQVISETPEQSSNTPRVFNNGYDGYGFYGESDDSSSADPDFYYEDNSTVGPDGNPKV